MKKKIVCIHLFNDYSGSPLVLNQTISLLLKDNYKVDLYTNETNGFLTDLKTNKFHLPYKRSNNKFVTLCSYLYSQVVLFVKLLKYRNDNVIFYINTIMPFGAALAGKLLNIDVIYHIHEVSISPLVLKKFLLKIIKLTSAKNIFVSSYLEKVQHIEGINSYTIYNSLPYSFTSRANKYEYNQDKTFNALMICSLKKYKGILEFIEIATICDKVSNIQFTLVLNAPKYDVDNFFKYVELPLNISINYAQKDTHEFYENASVVLNLSRKDEWIETFGMTILEAMSYGIPTIVPNIGGPVELIDDEIDGYRVDSYEIVKISNILMSLYKNPNKLKDISKKARKKSLQFSQELYEKNILSILEDR